MAFKRLYFAACLLLVLTGTAAADSPTAVEAAPPAIYTRQGRFAIPFRIDAPADVSPPTKVRLFISEDAGAKWHLESEIIPTEQKFDFRSSHDGEYWFTIRSVDAQGRSYPDGAYEPQLRVVVDTLAPRLDLKAERGADGEIKVHWDVLDTSLDPATFKLEYQVASGAWQTLAIDPDSQHVAKLTLVGETLWWPPAGSGKIVLRANVSDRAGNPAVSQYPIEGNNSSTARGGTTTDMTVAKQPATTTPDGRKLLEWPAEPTSETLSRSLPGSGPGNGRRPAQDSSWRVSKGGINNDATLAPGRRLPAQTVAQETSLNPATSGEFGSWPVGERPQMVNRRTFELDYEVEAVGNAGVAKVELWQTRDGGAHWQRFGRDDDNRSPIVVSVDAEGLYGFRVVVESGNGLTSDLPRDGDLPEVWINVDLTKPAAHITAADVGHDQGEITIRWDALDTSLESRPVSLWFSDQPGGPWTPIASGLENTGSFVWRLDNHVPQQVYLRLEVRDEAGNVGEDSTRAPILIDRQRPQGRIRGVRPAMPAASPSAGASQR
jgi:hypothetical protein